MNTIHGAVLGLLLVAGAAVFAQGLKPGPQVLTFFSDIDDSEQPYGLYLPQNFDASKKYPLVIMLHGAGSNHRLALRRVFGKSNAQGETDVEATRYFPAWKDVDYIVATPLARGTMGYQGIPEKDVYDVLADVKQRFPIDEDRVYLTGLSMGGGGTLWLGLTRPDLWAAIAPVCPAPPVETMELAGNALNIPMHVFQGGADPVVNPKNVRASVQLLDSLGTRVEYTEYPGVGHNSWENAYKDEQIFGWFAKFKRNLFPERVRFASAWHKYSSAYWVHLDELTPGTLASIDAIFTMGNRIEITTSALGAFSLHLKGHPKHNPAKTLQLIVDGTVLHASTADSVFLVKREGVWKVGRTAPVAKKAGVEGPLSDAFASRHLIVYGTDGPPRRGMFKARKDQADRVADWTSDWAGRPLLSVRVVADKDVRPSDRESSNLIFLGTPETNSALAKMIPRLPMRLDPADTVNGLLYVYPVDGKYIVVCTGQMWWPQGSGQPRARGFRFTSGPTSWLSGLPDFVVYKGSLEDPVFEGRFDNNWQLKPEDAEKLKAAGVVLTPVDKK